MIFQIQAVGRIRSSSHFYVTTNMRPPARDVSGVSPFAQSTKVTSNTLRLDVTTNTVFRLTRKHRHKNGSVLN